MDLEPVTDATAEDQPEQVITAHIAHQVLWQFGQAEDRIGYRPGGFHGALLYAIAKADTTNRARLAQGFPGYVAAVDLIEDHLDGVARLIAIAKGGQS